VHVKEQTELVQMAMQPEPIKFPNWSSCELLSIKSKNNNQTFIH
jgi:hypothetical protein